MKKIFDLAFTRKRGKIAADIYKDEDGDPVDVRKLLREAYPNMKEGLVMVRIITDDGTETELPFQIDTAREIIAGKIDGWFANSKDERVRVLAADLDGEFPVLGVIDGRPAYWDIYGQSQDRNPDNTLKLYVTRK